MKFSPTLDGLCIRARGELLGPSRKQRSRSLLFSQGAAADHLPPLSHKSDFTYLTPEKNPLPPQCGASEC